MYFETASISSLSSSVSRSSVKSTVSGLASILQHQSTCITLNTVHAQKRFIWNSLNTVLFLVILVVLSASLAEAQQILYQCREFTDPDSCGVSKSSPRLAPWLPYQTIKLREVAASIIDYQEYVLVMNGTNSADSRDVNSRYVLDDPQADQLSHANISVQFTILYSQGCDQNKCQTKVTVAGDGDSDNEIDAYRILEYRLGKWMLTCYDFRISSDDLRPKDRVIFVGTIDIETNNPTVDFPFMAIKNIAVFNGTCVERIGPRKEIWIGILATFTTICGLTFVYIAIHHIRLEHEKRVRHRLLAQN